MKRRVLAALGAVLIFAAGSARADGPRLSGRIKLFSSVFLAEHLDGRYFSHDSGEFGLKRLETRLSLTGSAGEKVSYAVRLEAFAGAEPMFDGRIFPESGPLGTPVRTEPFEIALYEGYVRVTGFLLKNLDLTLGKQRIAWGTADKISAVDNLNPVDFANFLTFDPDYFGERRPQTALNLEFHPGRSTRLQFVWLLSRQIAPLPYGFTNLLAQGLPPSAGFFIKKDRALLKNTNWAVRLSTHVFGVDAGLSFYRGNFDLPFIFGSAALREDGRTFGPDLYYRHPLKQVFGLDLAGELSSVGWWAEAAWVRPEYFKGFAQIPYWILPEPRIEWIDFRLFEKGFPRFVAGADYTFGIGNGLYLNLQYARGLFDEIDATAEAEAIFGFRKGMFFGEPGDYLVGRLEYALLGGDLKIAFNALGEFAGKNASAFLLTPGLELRVSDAVIVQAGAVFVAGDEIGTKFGPFKKDRLAFVSARLDF